MVGEVMAERRALPEGMTPRLLSREEAATYCGVSPHHFEDTIGKAVSPIQVGRRVLWDREAIDRWIDRACEDGNDARPLSLAERLNGDPGARR